MGLETITATSYISDLVATYPTGTDDRSTSDDHHRAIKLALKNSLPNIDGPVNSTDTELNFCVGVTALIQTQLDAKAELATTNIFTAPQKIKVGSAGMATTYAATGELVIESDTTGLIQFLGPDNYGLHVQFGCPSASGMFADIMGTWNSGTPYIGFNISTASSLTPIIAQFASQTVLYRDLRLVDTGVTAFASPFIYLDRESDSPAAGDSIGAIYFRGYDDESARIKYAALSGYIETTATGAQDGRLYLQTTRAGTFTARAYLGDGLVVGSPTGADKGAGTINAQAVYDDNVLLTDYVFDYALGTGITDEAVAVGFDARADMVSLETFSQFWKENKRLPTMPSREKFSEAGLSVGALAQHLWETVELQALHIEELNQRISALE